MGGNPNHLQARSGRVALPRTKLVLASAAAGLAAPEARRAPRRAGTVRRSVDDILVYEFNCNWRIWVAATDQLLVLKREM